MTCRYHFGIVDDIHTCVVLSCVADEVRELHTRQIRKVRRHRGLADGRGGTKRLYTAKYLFKSECRVVFTCVRWTRASEFLSGTCHAGQVQQCCLQRSIEKRTGKNTLQLLNISVEVYANAYKYDYPRTVHVKYGINE